MVFRDIDLHSSSSIPAVPLLVWSRSEAIVVAEVRLQYTPLTLSTSHLHCHMEHILDCWAKAKLEPQPGTKGRIPQV